MGSPSTFCNSTDENGVSGAIVDVRLTQDNLPLFFPLVGVQPTISAHARVAIEGVGDETNIRPLAVRDAGLTPCVLVNLRRQDNNNIVQTATLTVDQAATLAANGPIVWDNGAGTGVTIPSATNI